MYMYMYITYTYIYDRPINDDTCARIAHVSSVTVYPAWFSFFEKKNNLKFLFFNVYSSLFFIALCHNQPCSGTLDWVFFVWDFSCVCTYTVPCFLRAFTNETHEPLYSQTVPCLLHRTVLPRSSARSALWISTRSPYAP